MEVVSFIETPEGQSIAALGRELLLQYGVIHQLFAEVVSIKMVGHSLNVSDEEFAFCNGLYHYSAYYSLLEVAKLVEKSHQASSLWTAAQKLNKNVRSVQRHKTPFGRSLDSLVPALEAFFRFLESDPDVKKIKVARDRVIAHSEFKQARQASDIELTSFQNISRIISKIGELTGFIGILNGQVSIAEPGDQVFLYYESFNRLGVVSCSHLAFARCKQLDSFSLQKLQMELIEKLAQLDIAEHPLTPQTNLYQLGCDFLQPRTSEE